MEHAWLSDHALVLGLPESTFKAGEEAAKASSSGGGGLLSFFSPDAAASPPLEMRKAVLFDAIRMASQDGFSQVKIRAEGYAPICPRHILILSHSSSSHIPPPLSYIHPLTFLILTPHSSSLAFAPHPSPLTRNRRRSMPLTRSARPQNWASPRR